jgi:hypothetical protein
MDDLPGGPRAAQPPARKTLLRMILAGSLFGFAAAVFVYLTVHQRRFGYVRWLDAQTYFLYSSTGVLLGIAGAAFYRLRQQRQFDRRTDELPQAPDRR